MKMRRMGGYFTIEAAFLMPVFVCMIGLLLYLAFYMCNCAMLVQDAYIIGLRGSIKKELTNEETASYILRQGQGIASKYFAVSKMEKQVQVSGKEIQVELGCIMQVPFSLLGWEDGKAVNRIWERKEKQTIDRTNPIDFIRACRKLEGMIKK